MTASSVYVQIMDAVVVKLKAAPLTGIADANVTTATINKRKERLEFGIPSATVLLPDGAEIHDVRGGTNVHMAEEYPLVVLLVDNVRADGDSDSQMGTQHQTSTLDTHMQWRQDVKEAFAEQRLAIADTGICIWNCAYRPLRILNSDEWKRRNLWASMIELRFYVRNYRGSW